MNKTYYSLLGLSLASVMLAGASCNPAANTNTTNQTTPVTNQANGNAAGDVASQDVNTTPITPLVGQQFSLKVNQVAAVRPDNVAVKLTSVSNDSRCPADTQCIQAGSATVEVSLSQAGKDLGSASVKDTPITVGNYTVEVLNVAPEAKSGVTIAPSDYVITLVVNNK